MNRAKSFKISKYAVMEAFRKVKTNGGAARVDGQSIEEFGKLGVQMNQDKTRIVDLTKGQSFNFLGFDYKRIKTRRSVWGGENDTSDKGENSFVTKTQGTVSPLSITAGGSRCLFDQSDTPWLGKLLSGGSLVDALVMSKTGL